MKLLIDNQLPIQLAIHHRAKGHLCEHVLDAGLDEADDLTLWTHAAQAGQIVVSKDEWASARWRIWRRTSRWRSRRWAGWACNAGEAIEPRKRKDAKNGRWSLSEFSIHHSDFPPLPVSFRAWANRGKRGSRN